MLPLLWPQVAPVGVADELIVLRMTVPVPETVPAHPEEFKFVML
jgi:hypothetical protein